MPDDIKGQLQRLWQRGELCRAAVGEAALFPLSLSCKQPTAKVVLHDFSDLMDWNTILSAFAVKHDLQLQRRDINHRLLGQQSIIAAVIIATVEQAAGLIAKRQRLQRFAVLYRMVIQRLPALQAWLLKRPLKVLELDDDWSRLLDVCVWMQCNPRPKLYLRQVCITDVDSKFIESHRAVLAELFDVLLLVDAIDEDYTGVAGFAQRYGFLDKPLLLRVRPLDDAFVLLASAGVQDVTMTADAFASLNPNIVAQVKKVVIVENEINYLSFPAVPKALIIFGSGYGFEAFKTARWLQSCCLYYWGDMDTHGFAILNQCRAVFPHIQSFLMDKQTLLQHRQAWGVEPKQEHKYLSHLNAEEAEVYDLLRHNSLADSIRLEQERISFDAVVNQLKYQKECEPSSFRSINHI